MVTVRAYEELNDFLPAARRKRPFEVPGAAGLPVSGLLERLGIPAGAVDLVLVAGRPSGLDRVLVEGDRVALYPVFEALDVGGTTVLPGRPLRDPRFFADEHLARLARYLRLAGFDTRLAEGADDRAIVEAARSEGRILLTRDRHLVEFLAPSHVLVPRSGRPAEQFVEVVRRLQLESAARPFSRCMVCNSPLSDATAQAVEERVPDRVRDDHGGFLACGGCGRVYWPGSHHRRMSGLLAAAGIPVD